MITSWLQTCQSPLLTSNRVTVRLGSPPQWVDVLPSTSGSETLAIGLSGCDSTAQCRKARGGLFNMTASTSWNYKGNYEVALDRQLGYNSTGTYGFDTIALSDSASCMYIL